MSIVSAYAIALNLLVGMEADVPKARLLPEKMEYGDELCISPDGRTLVVGGHLSGVSIWDLPSRKKRLSIGEEVTALAMSPDGKIVACGHMDYEVLSARSEGKVVLFETATGKEVGSLTGLLSYVASIDFHPDGKMVCILCSTTHPMILSPDTEFIQELVVWNTNGKEAPVRKRGAYSQLGARFLGRDLGLLAIDVAWNKETRFISEQVDCDVVVLREDLRRETSRLQMKPIRSLAWSAKRDVMAIIGIKDDVQIRIWDAVKRKQRTTIPRVHNGRGVMAFGKDDAILACAEDTGVIQFWNIERQQSVAEISEEKLLGKHNRVMSLLISPDGRLLIAGLGDGSVALWEIEDYLRK